MCYKEGFKVRTTIFFFKKNKKKKKTTSFFIVGMGPYVGWNFDLCSAFRILTISTSIFAETLSIVNKQITDTW